MAKTMRKKNLKIQMLAGNSLISFLNAESEEYLTLKKHSFQVNVILVIVTHMDHFPNNAKLKLEHVDVDLESAE